MQAELSALPPTARALAAAAVVPSTCMKKVDVDCVTITSTAPVTPEYRPLVGGLFTVTVALFTPLVNPFVVISVRAAEAAVSAVEPASSSSDAALAPASAA